MSFIYVVGPSGAGKSALCKALASPDVQFVHVDLNHEVRRLAPDFRVRRVEDWNIRWDFCEQALTTLEQSAILEKVYLVDTGAGALQSSKGRAYFVERRSMMLCVPANRKSFTSATQRSSGKGARSPVCMTNSMQMNTRLSACAFIKQRNSIS